MPTSLSNTGAGLLSGLGAIGGAMPNQGNESTTGSSTTSGSNENQGNTNQFSNQDLSTWLSQLLTAISASQGSSSNQYNLDPNTQALLNKLTGHYSDLSTPFDSNRFQAGQMQNINNASDLQRQSVQNIMAARGVTGPAAATAQANIDNQRIGNIVNMQQQVPFLANQWDINNLGAASNFFSQIPKNTSTVNQQSTSQTQNTNTQGNNVASSTGGSTFYNQGNQSSHTDNASNTKRGSGGGIGGALSTGVGIAASLFSDETLKKDIQELSADKAVEKIMQLKPSMWRWTKDDSRDMGVIAQDLQKVMPELVHKDPEGSGKLKVNYAGLVSTLVGAMQAINHKVEATA